MNREVGTDVYTRLCIKQITSEDLLNGTGNYLVLCGDLNGKEIQNKAKQNEDTCLPIADSLSVQQKLTQHCKATVLQQKTQKTKMTFLKCFKWKCS